MEKQYAYQRIYQAFLQDILSGKLPAGSILPPETQIAQQFHVSRITSRRAIAMLAEDGYVLRTPGRGTEVVSRQESVRTIGLAMAEIDPIFGMDFLRGVMQEARNHGYLVICQTGYFLASHEEQCIADMVRAGVRGIIHIPLYEAMHCSDAFLRLTKKIPMVFADREIVGLDVPLVCTDNHKAVQTLCEKLYEEGHRNIAFVSSNTGSTAVGQRYKGYCLFCERMGLHGGKPLAYTQVRSILPGMNRQTVRLKDIGELARFFQENNHVTAVVAHTWQVAKMVCEAMWHLGLKIPRDRSVVCFDAPNRVEETEWISHIRQNEYAMGVRAVQRLLQQIDGHPVAKLSFVEGTYVEGGSCGPVPLLPVLPEEK